MKRKKLATNNSDNNIAIHFQWNGMHKCTCRTLGPSAELRHYKHFNLHDVSSSDDDDKKRSRCKKTNREAGASDSTSRFGFWAFALVESASQSVGRSVGGDHATAEKVQMVEIRNGDLKMLGQCQCENAAVR